MQKRTFASDNFTGVDPRVMSFLQEVNECGHARSYEGDDVTNEAIRLFKDTFGESVQTLFVPSGTGANILSLKLLAQRPYHALFCSDVSHIYEEESGALAANTGIQIFPIAQNNGKINLDALSRDVTMRKSLAFHSAMPKVVSIANSTEYGMYYTPEEVCALANFCHENDMYLHMDGCRLVNAAVALNVGLREFTGDVGVDVLSFGGAKNGLMSAEAVVVFNAPESDFLCMQKQAMQLVSKMRFVAGQFIPYLRDDIWRENAQRANRLAVQLIDGLKKELGKKIVFTQPVATNQIFCTVPKEVIAAWRAAGHVFYDWNAPDEIRLVTSWDNTPEDIDGLLELARTALS